MGAAGLEGFLLGAGLIVAIGAQNAFVLRQGLRREHVFAVTTVCWMSDAALIAVGVAGAGRLVKSHLTLLMAVTSPASRSSRSTARLRSAAPFGPRGWPAPMPRRRPSGRRSARRSR